MIEKKDEGNKFHRNQGYHARAIDLYSEGLRLGKGRNEVASEEAMLLTNRSNVYSVLGKEKEALADAKTAVKKDPAWFKVSYSFHLTLKLNCILQKKF